MKKFLLIPILLAVFVSVVFCQDLSTAKVCMILARDQARSNWQPDAMTCQVQGRPDYTGQAYSWNYFHYSNYTTSEMWQVFAGFINGLYNSPYEGPVTPPPYLQRSTIPTSIIDSDQALQIAENNGGYDFRQSHPGCSIYVICGKFDNEYPQYYMWKVYYNFTFYVYMDALTGNVLETGGGGGAQDTTEIYYDDGTPTDYYCWSDPNYGSANRLTTPSTKSNYKLIWVKIYLGDNYGGSNEFNLRVWSWGGSSPGSELGSWTATGGVANQWNIWDISFANIQFNSNTDFLVGMIFDGANYPTFGYDPVDNGRAWDYYNGTWDTWNETYFMRAYVVNLSTGVIEEIGNDLEISEISLSVSNTLFDGNTTISYAVLTEGNVTLRLYDLTGREVRTLVQGYEQPGLRHVIFDGKDSQGHTLPAGTYICYLTTSSGSASTKIIVTQ